MQPAHAFTASTRSFILTIALLTLTGCVSSTGWGGPGPRTSSLLPDAPQGAVRSSISWSFWGDPWELEIHRRVARAFEAENPTISVELLHQPWETYFNWLNGRWASGSAPDVMFLDNVPEYAKEGRLAPLDDLIQRDSLDLSDFYPRLLEQARYRGQLYGLPRDNDTKVIYYNRTLFRDAGQDPPRSGWSWTDLRNLASRLMQRDATGRPMIYGFAFEAEDSLPIWLWQNGGDVYDDPFEPRMVRLGEPAAVDALQFLADLVNADRVTPPPTVLVDSNAIFKLFREGRLAMAFGSHSQIPALTEEQDLRWDVVGLPGRQRRANLAGGGSQAISAESAKREAAWMLVKFLSGRRGQAIFNESGLSVPSRRSVREDNIFLRQRRYNSWVFAEETELGQLTVNSPVASQTSWLSSAAFLRLWQGEQSAREAVDGLVPHLSSLLGM